MSSLVDAAVGAGNRMGRYFSLISVLPATLLIAYVSILVAGKTSSGEFEPEEAIRFIGELELVDVPWFALGSLLVAMLLHPFQYAMTQLLEGYWGSSRIAIWLATSRIRHYRARAFWLRDQAQRQRNDWVSHAYRSLQTEARKEFKPTDPLVVAELQMDDRVGDRFLSSYVRAEAYDKALLAYPDEFRRIMPTRLGNALRRHEDSAGRQYGLDTTVIAPHVSLVAVKEQYKYAEDEGEQMDLAVRVCVSALLATAASAVLLVGADWWFLLTLLPYGVAYMSYRGAIAAAENYGVALATVLDLNRFAIYESLHLELPKNTGDEKIMGTRMVRLLAGEEESLDLFHALGQAKSPGAPDVVNDDGES